MSIQKLIPEMSFSFVQGKRLNRQKKYREKSEGSENFPDVSFGLIHF